MLNILANFLLHTCTVHKFNVYTLKESLIISHDSTETLAEYHLYFWCLNTQLTDTQKNDNMQNDI
jgi:hypothetical protein